MDDLSAFCCLNPSCADLGKRGHGNLTVTMRYGPNKSRRLLRCSTCTTRFSERKGTPLFDARLPPGKVTAVLAHVAGGIGTRKTARLTGVNKDTVNGTDRNRCSRKGRKTYAFSKDWAVHRAATAFSYFSYNFCWPVRTLRVKGEGGRWRPG